MIAVPPLGHGDGRISDLQPHTYGFLLSLAKGRQGHRVRIGGDLQRGQRWAREIDIYAWLDISLVTEDYDARDNGNDDRPDSDDETKGDSISTSPGV